MTTKIQIKCADHFPLAATLFTSKKPRGILVIGAAIGIHRDFYKRFAEFFSNNGFHCITFNYRGTGDSIYQPHRHKIKLEDWGIQDTEAIIKYAKARSQDGALPVHFIGHSIGGQMLGLSPSSSLLTSLIFIASSKPYWRRWGFPRNLTMMATTKFLIPAVAAMGNEFPAQKFGLGNMNIPSTTAKQWAKWMGHPEYFFNSIFNLDTSTFNKINQPLRSIGFLDDHLAPEKNIKLLLDRYPNAQVNHRTIDPKQLNLGPIGHSGFFKNKFKTTLWQDTLDWLNNR